MRTRFWRIGLGSIPVVVGLLMIGCCSEPASGLDASDILRETGMDGGLIVHVGCGDGTLTAALGARDNRVVHGLDPDPEQVARARSHVHSLGRYGRVAIQTWSRRRLPYIDNLVNLLVVQAADRPSRDEMMRVLCPGGVAYIEQDGAWTKWSKPWPAAMDEWTHYLHDPSNNAVAQDTLVGPVHHLQWNAGPKWTRSHEKMSAMNAMVSAGGRIFYILDEGPTASVQLPPQWRLIARDAFNGAILWKRTIPAWHPHRWPLKSGPAKMPRRLAAVGDRVYVTLGIDAPVSVLDAATGNLCMTYPDTAGTEELLVTDATVLLKINGDFKPDRFQPEDPFCWTEAARARQLGRWRPEETQYVTALQADTGQRIWRKQCPVVPLTLTADAQSVYFHDGDGLVCLDRETGAVRWHSDAVGKITEVNSAITPTLVVQQEILLFFFQNTLTALSAKTGDRIWVDDTYPRSGHYSPIDVLVVHGLVWSGGSGGRPFIGKDLFTGAIQTQFKPPQMTWFHNRCYRSKATDRFILASRTGIEYADVEAEKVTVQHWTRGACLYGIMPCNGLIYAPPHSCACLQETKTTDFNAFSAVRPEPAPEVPDEDRLEEGPAHGDSDPSVQPAADPRGVAAPGPEDWPTYRQNNMRSGCLQTDLAARIQPRWKTHLGGKLGSLVAADGRIFAVAVDAHTLHALDAQSGESLWARTVGGRIDSPPTVSGETVLFGSHDGWIYCLRARDGMLVWRFLAARAEQQLMSYCQIESVWPVHGSVLVQDGIVHCVAGRSMFLDRGMLYYRLDAGTGRLLSKTELNDRDPKTGQNLQTHQAGWAGLTHPVALPDVLSCDGERVYMRSQPFDLAGQRLRIAPDIDVAHQNRVGAHLFSPVGFLDDTWSHRNYWMLGVTGVYGWRVWFDGGRYAPSGRILSFDEQHVYAFGRKPEYLAQSPVIEYQLHKVDRRPDNEGPARVQMTEKRISQRATEQRHIAEDDKAHWKRRKEYSASQLSASHFHWIQTDLDLQARAMVLSNAVLFIAGPPNLVNEVEVFDRPEDPALQKKLEDQADAWRGGKGGLLWAVAKETGDRLAEYRLDSPPVFDGMIAAQRRLYLALMDGTVVCFEKE